MSIDYTKNNYSNILLPSYMLDILMIKRGILLVPGIVFSARDIDDVMRDMCNDWC